jgi:transposase InsO family protein
MANHLRAELVLEALEMAVGQRRPRDVIHHSDQGGQYTSLAFGKRCKEAGVRPSPPGPPSRPWSLRDRIKRAALDGLGR